MIRQSAGMGPQERLQEEVLGTLGTLAAMYVSDSNPDAPSKMRAGLRDGERRVDRPFSRGRAFTPVASCRRGDEGGHGGGGR